MGLISNCCNAQPWGDMSEYGICSDCKEHCEFVDEDAEETIPELKKPNNGAFSSEQQAYIDRMEQEAKDNRDEE